MLDAVRDLRTVVKCAPHDADAKSKLSECEKEYKRQEFEKAIAMGEKASVMSQFAHIGEMEVESR